MEAAPAETTGPPSGPVPAPRPFVDRDQHPIDGVVRCSICGRYPLVGEQVIRHAGPGDGDWACETCESSGRGAGLGNVVGADRVRSVGGAANVHRAA